MYICNHIWKTYAISPHVQVMLSLGDQSIQVPRTDIETIPFFAVYFKRWTSSTQMVLPDMPELKDLLLLKQLIAHCNTVKDDQLPDHFMVTFKLIRMADFLGCDTFLENTAKQLGTSVHKINNSSSIKTVREYVRNAYRWATKSVEINQEQFCSVCWISLAAQFPRLPPLWFAANLKSIWLVFQTSQPAAANHTNFYPAVFAEEQLKLSPDYPTVKFGSSTDTIKLNAVVPTCTSVVGKITSWCITIVAQYVKFRLSKGTQIMKILKQWILFICVRNKTKIINFSAKINTTLCHPLLQHHHHK